MKYFENKGFLPQNYRGLGCFDEDKVCDIFPIEPDFSDYTTFFFDAKDGNDLSDGLSENCPKKTLGEAERILSAFDSDKGLRIRLKGKTIFAGGLKVNRKTDSKAPTVICGYGDGLPILTGTDSVVLIACSDVIVHDLEITGRDAFRGIFVKPSFCGALKNITISNCYVHDINFDWYLPQPPKETSPDDVDPKRVCPEYYPGTKEYYRYNRRSHGGIIFLNDTDSSVGASWFENIFILGNKVENVARTGIYLANVWADQGGVGYGRNHYVSIDESKNCPETGVGYFKNRNVVCSGNFILCAGGDGMILSSVKHVFSEHNVCYYANYLGRTGYWNAGLWVFDAEEAWLRHNEAAFTYMRHNSNDAQGFDIDNACRKVVFKHNYVHHNEGGGLLVCNNKTAVIEHDCEGNPLHLENGMPVKTMMMGRWYDNLVCGNLFVNNGTPRDRTRSAFITVARETDWLFAYGNVVVLSGTNSGQSIIHTEDRSQKCYHHYYAENIFYCDRETAGEFTVDMMEDSVFDGNVYFQVGDVKVFLKFDPKMKTELPAFFDKETLYGFSTLRKLSKSFDFSKKIELNIKK